MNGSEAFTGTTRPDKLRGDQGTFCPAISGHSSPTLTSTARRIPPADDRSDLPPPRGRRRAGSPTEPRIARPTRNVLKNESVYLGDITEYWMDKQPFIFTVEVMSRADYWDRPRVFPVELSEEQRVHR